MIYLNLTDRTIIRKGMPMKKEICRINNGKMAEGVCGGIAKYFGIDVSIVRFVWLLLCLVGGMGIVRNHSLSALLFIPIGRTSPPNKKNGVLVGCIVTPEQMTGTPLKTSF